MFGLGLQFRSRSVCPLGAREEPLPLSYQAKSTHTKRVRDGERRGSERQEGSVTRLQTKEEGSLAAGDEFQEFEGKVEPRWLCARWQCGL